MALDFNQSQLSNPDYNDIDTIDNGSLVIMGIKTDSSLPNQSATITIEAFKKISGGIGLQGIQGPQGEPGPPGSGGGGDVDIDTLVSLLFVQNRDLFWEQVQKLFKEKGFEFTVTGNGKGSLKLEDGYFQDKVNN